LSTGHLPWLAKRERTAILVCREGVEFPPWFVAYQKAVANLGAPIDYEALAKLLNPGDAQKCKVLLTRSPHAARNGKPCGRALPCPHHSNNSKEWLKSQE